MKHFKKLVGEKCYLSPMNLEDAEQFTEWMNDLEVVSHLGHSAEPVSLAAQRKKLEEMSDQHQYAIVDLQTDRLIGSTGLNRLDHKNRHAMLGIMIGDKSYHNKGYGRDALRLLLGYGFNYLNLHNIALWVYSDNPRGIACYKSLGFKEIGRRRQASLQNGQWRDVILMDILEDEFRALHGEREER